MRRTVFALIAMFSTALITITATPAHARDTVDTRGASPGPAGAGPPAGLRDP